MVEITSTDPTLETATPVRARACRCAQVIEMTSVSSASDIWSVGCLAIELLTGNPPYSELQPMSAMFRVVQDAHPPLPKGVSQPMHNFLMQCFQKVGPSSLASSFGTMLTAACLSQPWRRVVMWLRVHTSSSTKA